MITAHPPSAILLQHLIDARVLSEPDTDEVWPGYYGRLVETPNALVVVYDTTGIMDMKTYKSGTLVHPGMQLRIRSEPEQYAAAWAKFAAVLNYIDKKVIRVRVTMDLGEPAEQTYMIANTTFRSGPFPLGEDVKMRKGFTANITATIAAV